MLPQPNSKRDEKTYTRICDLKPHLKNVNTVFIVLEKGQPTKTKDDHTLAHALVADQSACVHLSIWDTYGESIQPGDIMRLTGGYCTLFKNALVLYSGRQGTLERIGEFTMLFNESRNMSAIQWVADPPGTKNLIPMPQDWKGAIPPQQMNYYYSTLGAGTAGTVPPLKQSQ